MTHFLGYMQHFWKVDSHHGHPQTVNHAWGTLSDYFHKLVHEGDTLWIVVTGGLRYPDEWRLLQVVAIDEKYYDPQNPTPYCAQGNVEKSKVFYPDSQADLTPLLRELEFASGKQIEEQGRQIGLKLQSLRRLTDSDGKLLQEYANRLQVCK
jgi:hypothetical protein